jgi:hypothetical protein
MKYHETVVVEEIPKLLTLLSQFDFKFLGRHTTRAPVIPISEDIER